MFGLCRVTTDAVMWWVLIQGIGDVLAVDGWNTGRNVGEYILNEMHHELKCIC